MLINFFQIYVYVYYLIDENLHKQISGSLKINFRAFIRDFCSFKFTHKISEFSLSNLKKIDNRDRARFSFENTNKFRILFSICLRKPPDDTTKQQPVVVELVLVFRTFNKFLGKKSTFFIGGDVFCRKVEMEMKIIIGKLSR